MHLLSTKKASMALVLTVFLLSGKVAFAQEPFSGTVVDEQGVPVPGAAIVVDGTSNGTIADIDGKFTIKAKADADITVSFIGYKDVKTKLTAGMNIVLYEDSALLEEVVVVGYGTAKKETLTGAISVVGSKMMEDKGSLSSPVEALQGQVPGVIITRSSSAPGDEKWDMNIRV